MTTDSILDCLIIGGGPAGLMTAVYLRRYRRNVLIVDAGESRVAKIPRTRNMIGFPDGIHGGDLLQRLREHAQKYGTETEPGRIDRVERDVDGIFVAHAGSRSWRSRTVMLATGARDVEPDIPGLQEGLACGQVRYCPVCDGYETQGHRVAVLGRAGHGLRESLFISRFENEVTWLAMESHEDVEPQALARLRECGVKIAPHFPQHIRCTSDDGVHVELANGQFLKFDVIYPALGLLHQCSLATAMGARIVENGQIEVDSHQQTSIPGLYAAGDVAVDLNQISVAAGHAAIASTHIHNHL